jgi:hypothetical protein
MALKDLLTVGDKQTAKKIEIDKNAVRENLTDYQKIIDYWRRYPDKFIDYLCSLNPDNSFSLYYIQRLYLRVVMRYRTVYAVFSRGFSKSFLAVMCLMIKATLYPGAKLATVADGKSQSAAILSSKLREICQLIPAFANEIIWDTRGKIAQTTQSKDQVTYAFRNGSQISNAAMTETTRGQRFQSILVEESAKVDQEKLTEIIMPTLVISRQINGKTDPNEVLNQSAIFVTSAGYKGTYAYEKLIDTLCHSVAGKPNEAFILGGDWKIPVVEGLQPANFIQSQENDSSMDEAGFDREYNSIWAGTVEGAFFNPAKFDQHRILQLAQNQFDKGTSKEGYYCMGVDVGRFGDMTEVVVIKVTPAKTGVSQKQVVNIYTFEEDHFEKQAIQLKRLFMRFKCDMCVVDGNGVGAGLIDYLVRDQIDPETGDLLPNWGVYNDDDKRYKQWETEDTIHNAMFIMKANQPINSELFAYCQAQLNSGKLKFLIDESVAKNKLMTQSQGKKMTTLQRADYLRPYVETSILKSQMMNLVQQNEGANIILKQATRKVKKDKFSALIYGLSWPKLQEEKAHKRKGRNIKDFLMFTKHH